MQVVIDLLNSHFVRSRCLFFPLSAVGAVAIFIACAPDPPLVSVNDAYVPYGATLVQNPAYTGKRGEGIHAEPYAVKTKVQPRPGLQVTPSELMRYSGPAIASVKKASPVIPVTKPAITSWSRVSASALYRQVRVKKDYLSYRARGRSRKSMSPRYITIHSTQNWSQGADALRHSLALKKGALGRLSWHYTVDEDRAVQHLPTNEQGNHADYDGPGNRYSIGIEMCENRGNSRSATLERTAKLAAWLMYRYDLPVSRVVPHYKWPRKGKRPANKNCPHFLLDNGRPGRKWRDFQRKVEGYHRQISGR